MFRIEWFQSALNELASVWTQGDAALRQAITAASQSIDQQLRNHPERQGESRDDGKRILFVPPLGFSFRVDSQQQLVSILHVWAFRQRGR
jgi:hypothetical protein